MILVHTVEHRALRRLQGRPGARHPRPAPGGRPGGRASTPSSVIVQADHSHSGPDTIGIWGGVPTSYLRQLQTAAVDAAVAAWQAPRARGRLRGDGARPRARRPRTPSRRTSGPTTSSGCCGRRRATTAERIATLSNYSPHATVQKSAQQARLGRLAGVGGPDRRGSGSAGHGQGGVGTLGREDFGSVGANDAEREADARARLSRLIDEAHAAGRRVARGGRRRASGRSSSASRSRSPC